jgi:hypothetical protein
MIIRNSSGSGCSGGMAMKNHEGVLFVTPSITSSDPTMQRGPTGPLHCGSHQYNSVSTLYVSWLLRLSCSLVSCVVGGIRDE